MTSSDAHFPDGFDSEFPVGPQAGNRAYFGRNVLQGLIAGIDDFIRETQPRWRQYRSLGPVLLGSAMWIDDSRLIDKLGELAGASIVVTKQRRGHRNFEQLRELNERTPGLPAEAFAAFGGIALKVDGEPRIVGPSPYTNDDRVPTIRVIGFRRVPERIPYPPLMHAKLALLGHLVWHDEDAVGPADVIFFKPKRVWVSSANFTRSSRLSLEFGYWTEDEALLEGAEHFLTTAMRYSEGLDPESDVLEPDFADIEFDDDAIREALAEMDWDDDPF